MSEDLNDLSNRITDGKVKIEAAMNALLSIQREIAQKLGVNPAEFDRVFRLRHLHYLQSALSEIEDFSPSVAASLDDRPEFDESIDDAPPPPLFPPVEES
jgi:hypothetical protein